MKHLDETYVNEFLDKLDVLDIGDMTEEEFVGEIAKKANVEPSVIEKDAESFAKLNRELLSFIEQELKPKYKIGLLTNAHQTVIERVFGEHLPLFDLVLISSKLHMIKPHKDIFEFAIKEADISPEEILFVDDSKRNIEMAQSLGIQTILFTDFESFKKDLTPFIEQ